MGMGAVDFRFAAGHGNGKGAAFVGACAGVCVEVGAGGSVNVGPDAFPDAWGVRFGDTFRFFFSDGFGFNFFLAWDCGWALAETGGCFLGGSPS